ncbi:MAG: hypothetical protein QM770_09720 [Tepidisphaeraceae bacterium]
MRRPSHPSPLRRHVILALAAGLAVTSSARAVDNVNGGTLFTLTGASTTPNGAWCWFQDERAIIDRTNPSNPRLLLSSVSAGTGAEAGDIDLLWRDLGTGTRGEFELANQLEQDDHDSAALFQRPDGRYLAMYSKHGSDVYTRFRISTNPNDPTSWGAEQTITHPAGATYNNIYNLSADRGGLGRMYDFSRIDGYDPYIMTSTDNGSTWTRSGQLLTEGTSSDRPYVRYVGDGKSKVWVLSTDRHPRDFANNLYIGYVSDGKLYNSAGTVVDSNSFDATAPAPSSLTRLFANGSTFNGTTMYRAWGTSIELDKAKNPVAIFTARANDSDLDHRFLYARFDGVEWRVHEMAKAGGYLYASENDYTGLASIDPENPNVVYISSNTDPRSGTTTGKYEIYRGFTADFGETFSWSAVTENSTVDNIRPLVPSWDGNNKALVWMRGTYSSYTNWATQVVGITTTPNPQKAQLWRGTNAAQPTHWDANTTANWDSGGGLTNTYSNGDEVAFDDSAASFTVNIASTVSPMATAFHNTTSNYTVTGAGIAGPGELRVMGGGKVTLANTANTFTGETKIGNGTLALSGGATLASTSHIRVMSKGKLDVSATTGGTYALAGRKLTVDGAVVGNVRATTDSQITLNPTNAVQGDLTLNASSVTGAGGVTGNLSAEAGGVIRVGGNGFVVTTQSTPVTYTDATVSNTRAYDATTYPGTSWKVDFVSPATGDTTDNKWDHRTPYANGGNIITSNNIASPSEDAPLIRTTISGLTPGATYDVLGYFWNSSGTNWRVKATIDAAKINNNGTPTNLADDYLPTDASVAFAANAVTGWTNAPAVATGLDSGDNVGATYTGGGTVGGGTASWTSGAAQGYFTSNVLVGEGNRALYQASLGSATADASGQVVVYVDDNALGGQPNRTWYDGVGVRQTVTAPAPGVIDFNVGGAFTMAAGSTLELDVYGTQTYDRLVAGGVATLAGELSINLTDSSKLALGDAMRLLTAPSVAGHFDTIDNVQFAAGKALAVTYAANGVDLTIARPGDTNLDATVNFTDLLTLAASYGTPSGGTWATGDFNGDGVTNFTDLLTLASAYGTPVNASFASDWALAQSLVPEPATLGMAFASMAMMGRRVRRERQNGCR